MQIREDLNKGIYIDGINEKIVTNAKNMTEILHLGMTNRHVGSTKMNAESSRSHSIFLINIETKVLSFILI